jgi:hypothetical protein
VWGSQLMVAMVLPQIGASLRLVYSAPPLSGFLGALARYSARPRLPSQCHNHTATPIMKATDPGAVDPRSHHEAVRTMGNETRAIQMAVSSDLEGVVTLLRTRRSSLRSARKASASRLSSF